MNFQNFNQTKLKKKIKLNCNIKKNRDKQICKREIVSNKILNKISEKEKFELASQTGKIITNKKDIDSLAKKQIIKELRTNPASVQAKYNYLE